MGGLTRYTPVEMKLREPRTDIFEDILSKSSEQTPPEERLEEKLFRFYVKLETQALEGRRKPKEGLTRWESKLHDKVLVKSQTITDAIQQVTVKFIPTYRGPYITAQIITPSTYELSNSDGKIRGEFNKTAFKTFFQENKTASLYTEVNSDKNTTINVWLNDGTS